MLPFLGVLGSSVVVDGVDVRDAAGVKTGASAESVDEEADGVVLSEGGDVAGVADVVVDSGAGGGVSSSSKRIFFDGGAGWFILLVRL